MSFKYVIGGFISLKRIEVSLGIFHFLVFSFIAFFEVSFHGGLKIKKNNLFFATEALL